jgi:transposase
MTGLNLNRPDATEYAPYYGKYISLVSDSDILALLSRQLDETLTLLGSISESQANYRYAPEKWSIKELLGHLIDTERIFAYRALRFARNDKTPLQGFDQDDYIRGASFDDCAISDLASEFAHVRRSSLSLFKHLSEEAWKRRGAANDSEVSVRALAYIIAGHELHHVEILRGRYLQSSMGDSKSVPPAVAGG